MFGRHDIARVGKRSYGRKNLVGGPRVRKAPNDFVSTVTTVEQRQEAANQFAMQQRIELLRNKQRLRITDDARLQVRSQRRELDRPLVLRRDSSQYPFPGNFGILRRHFGNPCRLNR